jgi:hypothetical protein
MARSWDAEKTMHAIRTDRSTPSRDLTDRKFDFTAMQRLYHLCGWQFKGEKGVGPRISVFTTFHQGICLNLLPPKKAEYPISNKENCGFPGAKLAATAA